ncbi:MAG: VanZ family protein [Actinomycetales bacterium]|nr:MAG: VanZ family protein [Actinomycetales bacterium]
MTVRVPGLLRRGARTAGRRGRLPDSHDLHRLLEGSRRWVVVLAALYGVALALVAFWPTHVDQGINLFDYAPVRWLVSDVGLQPDVAAASVEKTANVLLFVPLGAFAMMIWPSLTRRSTTWSGFALTVFIEVGQAVARPGRTASVSDIVTNTLGAYIGASLVVLARDRLVRTSARRSGIRG